jgi:hypothetical protein
MNIVEAAEASDAAMVDGLAQSASDDDLTKALEKTTSPSIKDKIRAEQARRVVMNGPSVMDNLKARRAAAQAAAEAADTTTTPAKPKGDG